jgi:four helix bundle protein
MNQNIGISERTKALAIRIVKACSFLDEKPGVCRTLSKQMLRSGTSIGANVREAQSAQSDKDKSKIKLTAIYLDNCELRIANCEYTPYVYFKNQVGVL